MVVSLRMACPEHPGGLHRVGMPARPTKVRHGTAAFHRRRRPPVPGRACRARERGVRASRKHHARGRILQRMPKTRRTALSRSLPLLVAALLLAGLAWWQHPEPAAPAATPTVQADAGAAGRSPQPTLPAFLPP